MFCKNIAFSLMGLLAAVMAVISICLSNDSFYSSPAVICGWGLLVLTALVYILKRRLWHRPATFMIHVAFAVILLGGLCTHLFSESGTIHVRTDCAAPACTLKQDLPFSVKLKKFEVITYAGTTTPMNYVTTLLLGDEQEERTVSMNNVLSYRGYRFFQSSYDDDMQGSKLIVTHDPVGVGITYVGYALLLLSFLAYPLQQRRLKKAAVVAAMILAICPATASAASTSASVKPKFLPKSVAAEFDSLCVMYGGRIAPFSTFARDFTVKLSGNTKYRGLSAEQVTTGFLFHFDSWRTQPIIKVKSSAVRKALNLQGKYASYNDFLDPWNQSRLAAIIDSLQQTGQSTASAELRPFVEAAEKVEMINSLRNGASLRFYPISGEKIEWYSPADRLPLETDSLQWIFIKKSLGYINETVLTRSFDDTTAAVHGIAAYQRKVCGDAIPSRSAMALERTYYCALPSTMWAGIYLTIAIAAFLLWSLGKGSRRSMIALVALTWVYVGALIGMRWGICCHVPLSNGFETMQFLAWAALTVALCMARRSPMLLWLSPVVAGLAMMVATFSFSNPEVTPLMPVLASPLLSIHVVVVMLSYALLAMIMLMGVAALINSAETERLARVSRSLLVPALFLLASGIFIGAVWANNSWGRYWGWDPKEVWALITLLVYSFAIHGESLPAMRRPRFYHIYVVAAFLCVIVTYFGVNYLLGGMHSYA
jgi:ABC-type transport system involved in cytochrome c biogenesis permease subunit